MKKKQVTIIGLGRFGKLLHSILKEDFELMVYDKKTDLRNEFENFETNLNTLYSADTVFLCVPISQFEPTVRSHRKYFNEKSLLIDVLSIKTHPKEIFEKYLPKKVEAMLTHPMFGPDSVQANGLANQPMVMSQYRASDENYAFWKNYFESKKLRIVEMTAEEHDKLAANSQGVTHFLGRLLKKFGYKNTSIDSLGATKLNEVMNQTCNDTWELFVNLQNYNPHTKQMRLALGKAYDKVYNSLLPKQVNPAYITFGIQGGPASFNEQAIYDYIKRHHVQNFKIKYLYTSEKVLKDLHAGDIDFGIFAMHNSVGGIVTESVEAIAKYKFRIVEEFAIKISHHLMKLPHVSIDKIDTIMAHDQVFKQCVSTLKSKYSHLKQETGKGDYMDGATLAKAVANGKFRQDIFMLGNKMIADLYGFEVVAENLQDDKENFTSFLVVSR
jgi:prephenate dehydrogenase